MLAFHSHVTQVINCFIFFSQVINIDHQLFSTLFHRYLSIYFIFSQVRCKAAAGHRFDFFIGSGQRGNHFRGQGGGHGPARDRNDHRQAAAVRQQSARRGQVDTELRDASQPSMIFLVYDLYCQVSFDSRNYFRDKFLPECIM